MRVILVRKKKLVVVASLALIIMQVAALSLASERSEPVVSYAVANRVIVVDPGHGGIDPGAVNRGTGLVEKEVNLAIARKLAGYLAGSGALVIMTRDSDRDLSSGGQTLIERKRSDLEARVRIAAQAKAALYLGIHCNAEVNPRWRGAQTFYWGQSQVSRQIATHIQHRLRTNLGNTHRKAKPGTFFITERTSMPAVLVEVGFLSNPDEARLLADPAYQAKVAYAIFSGLADYFAGSPVPADAGE